MTIITDTFMERMAEMEQKKEPPPKREDPIQARVLIDAAAYLAKPFVPSVGMLICHKKGLWSGYLASRASMAIVTQVFETPKIVPSGVQGVETFNFHHVLDMAILHEDKDGDLFEYAVDSRFFEPYEGEVA